MRDKNLEEAIKENDALKTEEIFIKKYPLLPIEMVLIIMQEYINGRMDGIDYSSRELS